MITTGGKNHKLTKDQRTTTERVQCHTASRLQLLVMSLSTDGATMCDVKHTQLQSWTDTHSYIRWAGKET